MVVNLSIRDRLTIIAMLPTAGNMSDLVEIVELVKSLRFTDEEKDEIQYKEDGGQIKWNPSKDIQKEVDINYSQLGIIKKRIQELDSEGKITLSTLDTCLKFSKL